MNHLLLDLLPAIVVERARVCLVKRHLVYFSSSHQGIVLFCTFFAIWLSTAVPNCRWQGLELDLFV